MDHPIRLDSAELAVRPWRTATVVVAAIAAVELALLVMAGGALLAKPEPKAHPRHTASQPDTSTPAKRATLQHSVRRLPVADLPRRKVKVVVLNGNGRQGAAAAAAERVHRKGYRIGLVANAPSHDYATSLVMYRKGFQGEARRLARDLGVTVVGPLDGMRPGQLDGAHAVLILGG